MVQVLLSSGAGRRLRRVVAAGAILLSCHLAGIAGSRPKQSPVTVPQLELEGGRKLVFEGSFQAASDVGAKRGFWTRMIDIVAGEGIVRKLATPYSMATDSHGRILVTDPAMGGIHIFDFAQHKYKFISHKKDTDGLESPQCIAVDNADNIYVTDSEAGKIFVFQPSGKFQRVIGSLRGGEGIFKRPTGIAVDSDLKRIYVTDTLRNQVFILDMNGTVLQKFGKNGTGAGEFNFPTELRLNGPELVVIDAMNFRVQVFDRSGNFKYSIGQIGQGLGEFYRPKGVALDSEGHLYVLDGLSGLVQVFDSTGQLLYYFGAKGTGFGEFRLPTDLFIDRNDRVYVVDSYNRRVQVFHYYGLGTVARRAQQ